MTPSSVIVVKPGSLGDIVHTLPAVHFLKSTFPGADFRWIVNEEWVPFLEGNTDLRAVISFPRSRFRGLPGTYRFLRWCNRLSALQPDLVLDFQGLLRSAWIAQSLKPGRILGLSDSREGSAYFYQQRAAVRGDQHAVDRYLELAKLAGADVTGDIRFPLPEGWPIPSLDLADRFIALHPFSRGKGKSMTPDEVRRFTQAVSPRRVVVVGRSTDEIPAARNLDSLVNQTDLGQLIWLFRRATCIVSVDSGPMHIGAALTSSLLSIHTWSDPRLVGPYNQDAWVWKAGLICRVGSLSSQTFAAGPSIRPDPLRIAEFVCEHLLP